MTGPAPAATGSAIRRSGAGLSRSPGVRSPVIIVIVLLLGACERRYSSGWGYYPSGGLGLVLIVLIGLLLMGVI